jgi:hypothetical protein
LFHGGGDHVFKMGANVDLVKYDVFKDNRGTPEFDYSNAEHGDTYGFRSPFQLIYGTGNPNLNTKNNQLGAWAGAGAWARDDVTPEYAMNNVSATVPRRSCEAVMAPPITSSLVP